MQRFVDLKRLPWVCHHLHLDKSKTVDVDTLQQSLVHMKEKWTLMCDIKHNYNRTDLKTRMLSSSAFLVKQGCKQFRTHIDVDSTVGLLPLYSALELKSFWKYYGVDMQIGTQLLDGLETTDNRNMFYKASKKVD